MNLRDPKPSDPSHPRPDPATPVNSPWRQPPPRAPSMEILEIQALQAKTSKLILQDMCTTMLTKTMFEGISLEDNIRSEDEQSNDKVL